MKKKRNKKYTPYRPKGQSWWTLLTPFTTKERNEISLDAFSALTEIEEGRITEIHLGIVSGYIRVAHQLCGKLDQSENAREALVEGYEAFWRIVKRWGLGNSQDHKDLETLRSTVLLADDIVQLVERHEFVAAANRALECKIPHTM